MTTWSGAGASPGIPAQPADVAAEPRHPESEEAWLARDRAAMLYDHGLAGLAMTAFASAALGAMVATPDCRVSMMIWLLAMTSVQLLRAIDIVLLHPARREAGSEGMREIRRFGIGNLATAALWAAFPVLFFPLIGAAGRMASALVVATLAGASATTLGASLPLLLIYSCAQILPASVIFLTLPGREPRFLGMLGLVSLGAMVISSRIAHRSVMAALRLGRTNQTLVAQAEEHRARTELVNEELLAAQIAVKEANRWLEQRIENRTADLAQMVGERSRATEALARLATTDPLTRLPNRATFAERLAQLVTEAGDTRAKLALLFLDLENFKQVNDVRGHQTGDQVLRNAAQVLGEVARGRGEVARWGGDEFVIAMPERGDADDAMALAHDLLRAFETPLNAGIEALRLDATIGLARYPTDAATPDELIRAAEIAMYEAKKLGRRGIKLFDPVLASDLAERHFLEQALRHAIRREEFSLVFQPIVSASTGRCEAFEALLRWSHPTRGLIGPAIFIPIAEQSGQIGAIGQWVLAQACRAATCWSGEGRPISVTVNVSVAQVLAGTVEADVEAALLASGLDPERLQLEITESIFLSDPARATPTFEALRLRGIRILLDDFGTGFSSMAYLGSLPIDTIKIDQSLVQTADRDDYAIIGAILAVARAHALEVTAEGVETQGQHERLSGLGIDRLQGYLFGRPIPAAIVGDWLKGRKEGLLF